MAQLATINPLNQFFALNGDPLNNGKLYFGEVNKDPEQYPVQMYWDSAGLVPALQPIRTTSGYPARSGSPAVLYCESEYSIRVRQSNDVQVFYLARAGTTGQQTLDPQWRTTGVTPSFASANSFTLTGDQTAEFQPGRRARFAVTAGTVYGSIVTSVYGALTTVTMAMDSPQVLDAGLSSVDLSILTAVNSAVPATIARAGANTDITSLGNNTSTIYTTAGTSTAYTITPDPAITAYAIGQSFMVNFNAASGASPTLQINGIATPPNLVQENPDGTYSNIGLNGIPINHRSPVTLISTTQAWVENVPNPVLTSATAVSTVGGTSWTITGIPSSANHIECIFDAVSSNSSSDYLVRGGSGSTESSGYDSSAEYGGSASTSTAGFIVKNTGSGNLHSGNLILNRVSGNRWISSGVVRPGVTGGGGSSGTSSGSKTFSGAIDRIQLTTVNGTDVGDNGQFNINYW